MSRVGKIPVVIPEGVDVSIANGKVVVTGPKGKLERDFPKQLKLLVSDGKVLVFPKSNSKLARALHGTFRSHVSNMVKGVSEGWKKELEVVGTGYKAEVKGKELVLVVGFSHPVPISIPEGVNVKVERNVISLEGADKEVIGQLAARIRKVRPPEPYKGKGISYLGEEIRRKVGKSVGGASDVGSK